MCLHSELSDANFASIARRKGAIVKDIKGAAAEMGAAWMVFHETIGDIHIAVRINDIDKNISKFNRLFQYVAAYDVSLEFQTHEPTNTLILHIEIDTSYHLNNDVRGVPF